MRFSSKPVSSPGRPENYPPVLVRFLRSNVSSRSRGRSSRSSPIFIRRKNTPAETQEPSSPKVTCMGQVRMTRSKKQKPRPGRPAGGITLPQRPEKSRRRRCSCVQNAFFCRPFAGKHRPKCFKPIWRKWVLFSYAGFPRKSEKRSSSSRSEPIFGRSAVEPENQKEEEANSIKSFNTMPPRNALLLTRCRSAPYRSSSLACRFWGSPISGDEEQNRETELIQKRQQQDDNNEEDSNVVSGKVSVSGELTTEVAETERFENPNKESEKESGPNDEPKPEVFNTSPRRRLVLTRCKSEPARTGERLVPEMGFWKNRRLGFT